MAQYGKMLRVLKQAMDEDFTLFPSIFFNKTTGDIYPYDKIKDFCMYWLQKDIDLYRAFREEFHQYRETQLKNIEAITVINDEMQNKKVNPLITVQFKIRTIDYVDEVSVILNLSEMLIGFCSEIISEASPIKKPAED